MAVGSISKSEAILSEALAPAVEEAREYVRAQPSANLDETGWREGTQRAWLWIATTPSLQSSPFRAAVAGGRQGSRRRTFPWHRVQRPPVGLHVDTVGAAAGLLGAPEA